MKKTVWIQSHPQLNTIALMLGGSQFPGETLLTLGNYLPRWKPQREPCTTTLLHSHSRSGELKSVLPLSHYTTLRIINGYKIPHVN